MKHYKMKHIIVLALIPMLLLGCGESRERFVEYDMVSPELDVISYTYVGKPIRTEQQVVEELKELQKFVPEPYKIGMADVFSFTVFGEPSLEVLDVIVRTDGSITLPLIGDIEVEGLTMPEATAIIDEKYRTYLHEPRCILMPKKINSGNFTILGKVQLPGVYPIDRRMHLVEAVATAGGFAMGYFRGNTIEMADLEHSYVVRDGQLLPVNFIRLVRDSDMLHNIPLKPNDYIYIPSARNQEIYVLGAVLAPEAYGYRDDMTVSHAIANARGFVPGSQRRDIRVLRGTLSNPVVFNVDYSKVETGLQPDFKLRPGDIVFVPHTTLFKWNEIVTQILPSIQLLDHAGITNNDDGN
jgi:polysaccharide biosynthesis/export protein